MKLCKKDAVVLHHRKYSWCWWYFRVTTKRLLKIRNAQDGQKIYNNNNNNNKNQVRFWKKD